MRSCYLIARAGTIWPVKVRHLLWIGLSCVLSMPATATVFRVEGTGEVPFKSGDLGVVGETLSLSFSYDSADFVITSPGSWRPVAPLPLTVIGSQSGPIPDVGPITSVGIHNNASGKDLWSFASRFAGRGTSLFKARNETGSAFDEPLPENFEIAHTRFVEQLLQGFW